jgi:hypothetical protein
VRAVSLSNPRIIEQLNAYYVPVFLSNEDFTDQGPAPAAAKAELHRIHRDGLAKGLSVGTVHAFILAPDGSVRDSLHTAEAAKADRLLVMLDRNVRALNVQPGKPIVPAVAQTPPQCLSGDTQVALVARYLQRSGDRLVPVESDSGDWTSLPSQEWLSLSPADVRSLTGGANPRPGNTRRVDAGTVNRILSHFYPPTENWEADKNTIRESALTANVSLLDGKIAQITYTGSLKMDHWFYHKPDDRYVEAKIEGYADIDAHSGKLLRIRLATTDGQYRGGGQTLPFGVAVTSVAK